MTGLHELGQAGLVCLQGRQVVVAFQEGADLPRLLRLIQNALDDGAPLVEEALGGQAGPLAAPRQFLMLGPQPVQFLT